MIVAFCSAKVAQQRYFLAVGLNKHHAVTASQLIHNLFSQSEFAEAESESEPLRVSHSGATFAEQKATIIDG